MKTHEKPTAFTLIELLIVVAIIAIIVAIAIPNMMEAQTRAKVARVRADQRTVATALEMYRMDNNNYPPSLSGAIDMELAPLTTPIAYISSFPKDPFLSKRDALDGRRGTYDLIRFVQTFDGGKPLLRVSGAVARSKRSHYFLVSCGPDRHQQYDYLGSDIPGFLFSLNSYDPSNGSASEGDIYHFGATASAQ